MALKMMTQTEMAEELATRLGWTKSDVRLFLAELEDLVRSTLKQCVRTKIAGVVIQPKLKAKTKARMGRNPATGAPVKIKAKPASVRVVGTVSKALKDHAPSVKKLTSAL